MRPRSCSRGAIEVLRCAARLVPNWLLRSCPPYRHLRAGAGAGPFELTLYMLLSFCARIHVLKGGSFVICLFAAWMASH